LCIKESDIFDLVNTELEELKNSAQLRANDLLRSDELRAKSQGNADAYAYCQIRLRSLLGIFSPK